MRPAAAPKEPAAAERPVGPLALLALGVNGIVGVGIFFVPADLAAKAPASGSILVFAATALALAPVAATFAVLGRRFDRDGGPVVFARAAFGEHAAFMVGWVAYVSAIASTSATCAGLAAAVAPSLGLGGPAGLRAATAALVTGLALAVATGIRVSARTWTALTVLKLIPLLLLVACFAAAGRPSLPPLPADAAWVPAALTATFALQGFEIVPVIAGQARGAARAVPAATLGSLALAALLYVGLQAACVAALPQLAASAAPLADAAAVYGGPALQRLVLAGTSVSALGITFGMMVTTPRYLTALAQGGALGRGLDAMNARGVPARALLATWALVSLLVQLSARSELFNLSATAVLIQFVSAAAALAALALRRERGLRRLHLVPAAAAAAVGLVIVAAGASPREAAAAAAAIAAGLALRWAAGRARPRPQR